MFKTVNILADCEKNGCLITLADNWVFVINHFVNKSRVIVDCESLW
jgi:hypothetical protein